LVARPHEIQHSLLTLIFGGVLERFPRLKVVSAENDIAWTPHLLERADKYYRRLRKGYDTPLSLKPSEYSRRRGRARRRWWRRRSPGFRRKISARWYR